MQCTATVHTRCARIAHTALSPPVAVPAQRLPRERGRVNSGVVVWVIYIYERACAPHPRTSFPTLHALSTRDTLLPSTSTLASGGCVVGAHTLPA